MYLMSIFSFRIEFLLPLQFRDAKSFSEPFEIHSRVKKSFEMVSLAVSQKRPVLLYGPSGSGKSALIRKLADESGNQGMVYF